MIRQSTYLLKTVIFILVFTSTAKGQEAFNLKENFNNHDIVYTQIGKGECYIENGKFISKEAYARFGNAYWKNYRMSFKDS